jgi:undecaprenyl-diphosphatase
MSLWLAALLGVVQGLTEFLPISSTAHLRVIPALIGKTDPGSAFTAVLQLGSVAAVIIYFWKDLVAVTLATVKAPRTPEARLSWLLAAATVPIVILGLALKKQIEGDLRALVVVAGALITVGIAMAAIDRYSQLRAAHRTLASITFSDAMLVGFAQCLALVPGVSRSGATICMALLVGFARTEAARFSFLLSIPAVGGAGIYEARHAFADFGVAELAVGTAVAGVTSYLSIAWLMRWLGTHQLLGFAIYRIVCGLALLAAIGAGYLHGV